MEAFYKLAYDIGCYYAFVAFFLSYVAGYKVNMFSFLVILTACFIATCVEKLKEFKQVVRIGAFVLPTIPFLLETNIWGKLVLILPWIYLVVTVVREGYDISYKRFKKTYLVLFWAFAIVFGFFVGEDKVKGEVALVTVVPFLLILLVSGVFLLQMLRYQSGASDKKKLEKYQHRQLIIFMAAVTVLTLGNLVELLYTYVFFPLSNLVLEAGMAALVYIVSRFDGPVKPPKPGNYEKSREFQEYMKESYEKIEASLAPIKNRMQELSGEPKDLDLTPLIIIVVVLGAIVILAVMIGGKRTKRRQAAVEDEREDSYDEVAVHKELKKRFVRPEIIIRYYYREFMKKSEAKKHKLEVSDTTKEILAKYRTWNNVTPKQTAEAEEAMALYQKTRYSKEEMTHTDAKRMKALVKGL